MKRGHEVQIGQVSNGLVVKIGCQLLVADVDELHMLEDYYNGEVPIKYKKLFGSMPTHIDDTEQGEVCEETCYAGDFPVPGFLKKYDCEIVKAKNGWVVNKHGFCSIAKTEKQLMEIILK